MKIQYISDDGQAWDNEYDAKRRDEELKFVDAMLTELDSHDLMSNQQAKDILLFLIEKQYININ